MLANALFKSTPTPTRRLVAHDRMCRDFHHERGVSCACRALERAQRLRAIGFLERWPVC